MLKKPQDSIYEQVTHRIIAALEGGTEPWRNPWRTVGPCNAVSGRAYRGINVLLLALTAMERRYTNPGWVTYRQAALAGGHVRKGERSTAIVWYQRVPRKVSPSASQTANSQNGEDDVADRTVFLARVYHVFNLDQCDGLESLRAKHDPSSKCIDPIPLCEDTITRSGAVIEHGMNVAAYCPSRDVILMPHRATFEAAPGYYATLAHEALHWTGAQSRLNRQGGKRFADPAYCFEELVAEIGASFVCARWGIEHIGQSAAYIASWIRALRSDNRVIFDAARLASAGADYLLGTTLESNDEAAELAAGSVVAA